MSVKQYNFGPVTVLNQTVSANVSSLVSDIFNKDNIIYQYSWSGTLVGTVNVQVSQDYDFITGAGTWINVILPSGANITSGSDTGVIELNQLSSKFIKTNFVWTSGSGTLTIKVVGKAI